MEQKNLKKLIQKILEDMPATEEDFSLWEKEIVAKGELIRFMEYTFIFFKSFIWTLAALKGLNQKIDREVKT